MVEERIYYGGPIPAVAEINGRLGELTRLPPGDTTWDQAIEIVIHFLIEVRDRLEEEIEIEL